MIHKLVIIFYTLCCFVTLNIFANLDDKLIDAAYLNHSEQIKSLLNDGADPAAKDSQALIYAAENDNAEIIILLLTLGANPKAQNSQALIEAAKNNNIKMAKLLIQKGADPKDQESQVLIEAVKNNSLKMIKLLIEKEADPKAQESQGFILAVYKSNFEIAQFLIQKGANVDAQDSQALIIAIANNNIKMVELLIEENVNVNARDSQALINAIAKDNLEIVQLLIDEGVNIDAQNSQAFIDAAAKNKLEIVQLLIEEGADVDAQNSQALIDAIAKNNLEIVQLLIEEGVNINARDSQALIDAMTKNKPEIIEAIIGAGIDINLKIIKTILLSGNHRYVKYLFDKIPQIKDAYLIGVGLYFERAHTTAQVLQILNDKIKTQKNAYHVEISLEIAQDEDIMQHFSGFINPGAFDSYPRHENPFTLESMPFDNRMYHEKVYQEVITMAKKYDIPYLGICAGSQHLVLNNNGSLKKGGYHGSIKINFIPGTIPHFLFLTEEEQEKALATCKLNPIELIDAYVEHRYVGYNKNLGMGIRLAAVSEEGIPEAMSLGANKIGVQFHPEMHYYNSKDSEWNREKQFIDNVFGIFEGYYRSMQYAKKMGIDRAIAQEALRKVNDELVNHLENCVTEGSKNSSNVTLWGKDMNIEHPSGVKTVSLLPGITPEDVAITQDEANNLIIYSKDERGQLTILGHFEQKGPSEVLRLEFADGSIIELGSSDIYQSEMSFPAESLVKLF